MKNKLKYIASISGSSCGFYKGEKKYFSTGAVQGSDKPEDVRYIDKPSRADLVVKESDILVAKMKNTNKTAFVTKDMENNIYSTGFTALKSNGVFPRYLFYLLSGDEFETYKNLLCNGTTQEAINEHNLMNIELTYVESIDCQMRIADFLDKKCSEIDALSADIENQIETLGEYKKSVITEAVTKGLDPEVEMKDSGIEWIGEIPKGWTTNKIKYLFENRKGLSITKANLTETGLPVVSYGQIHSKLNTGVDIKPELLRYVDYSYQKRHPQCEVLKQDFIFADTSEDYDGCGNCVYKRDDETLFAGYHSIILHSRVDQDNRYFAYLFKTDCWRKQIREIAFGVKVFSISQASLINSSVIVPEFSEQQKIADYLDEKCGEIDAIIATKKQQLETLAEYKKSLIYEYVTGKKEVPC